MNYKAGDVYSINDGAGKFGIIKVLVVEPEIIHVRIYKNKFDHRPKAIDTKQLSLGRMTDKDGFGIGHIALALDGLMSWKPEMLTNEEVTDDELEGYYIWLEQ